LNIWLLQVVLLVVLPVVPVAVQVVIVLLYQENPRVVVQVLNHHSQLL
jgi:hypothetical protein